GTPPLHRTLITRAQAAACVQRRAFELFAARGVHRTVGRTGLLVVISELERHVVILGDSKIQELIGHEGFQEHVQKLIQRLKSGEGARGILELIEDFRPLLAQHAPRKIDDVNELPDAVIRA
ncbi:MAG TPA: hypothetical protein VFQ61_27755, partial [Polyangiaceae bacterium]|nr:hypothetical protein [Polyangiaceae bacterium]